MDDILYKGVSIEYKDVLIDDTCLGFVGRLVIEGSKTFICSANCEVKSEVIPETVCKYLGFEDKNNNEVFEDDVLKLENGKLLRCERRRVLQSLALRYICSEGEVIGNIHTHPELVGECDA